MHSFVLDSPRPCQTSHRLFDEIYKQIAELNTQCMMRSSSSDVEGFEVLQKLADLLEAQLGATSLPVDEGWISEDCKIGQTEKTVKPKL